MCYPFNNENCCEYCDRRKIVVAQENGKSFVIENTNGKLICKVKIDNCLQHQGNKCDYLILNCCDGIAFFIELKGSDLSHALKQINASLDYLHGSLKGFSICARVVLSKANTPDQRSTELVKFKKRLRIFGGDLVYKTVVCRETC